MKNPASQQREKRTYGKKELIQSLRDSGLQEGDTIALHASLKSLGYVKGGAKTVIEAFLHVLGPCGTMMMPTHTYCMTPNPEQFHIDTSPSKVGLISETFRCHPMAVRSFHPTHSVAAIGPLADFLTRDALSSSPCGINNPFHRLEKCRGRIMLLGTNHQSNTHIHTAEVLAKAPYLEVSWTAHRNYEISHLYQSGSLVERIHIFQIPGCSKGFQKIQPFLDRAGIVEHVQIAMAPSQFFYASDLTRVTVPLLQENPDMLLCHDEKCSICPRRREYLQK